MELDPIVQQFWFVIGGVVLVGAVWVAKWITREIAEAVVDSIGDTLAARWQADMKEALKPIYAEVTDNGGSSLKDRVGEMHDRLGEIETQLEAEGLFKPPRRPPYHFNEDDAYPA